MVTKSQLLDELVICLTEQSLKESYVDTIKNILDERGLIGVWKFKMLLRDMAYYIYNQEYSQSNEKAEKQK